MGRIVEGIVKDSLQNVRCQGEGACRPAAAVKALAMVAAATGCLAPPQLQLHLLPLQLLPG